METENDRVQENRYDAENLRFELLEKGRRTSFVYHNGELLHEEGREEQETSYHLGVGIDAFQRGQELFYCHRDEQLSMALITGGQGEIQNSYQYDAFGAQLEGKEQFHNRIRYTGQQYDELTEQYYLRARYYNPVLGRFMQEDVYQGDGLNLYAYCGNNPVVYYDPSGYEEKGCVTAKNGGDGKNNGDTVTPEQVVAFGNSTNPRGARPSQDFHVNDFDDVVGPECGPFPLGASAFDKPSNAPITGWYHILPKGTQLPDGLAIIADGIDVNPKSPHGAGHHTIFPTIEMTVEKFNELFKSLPWSQGDKKR